MSINVYQLWDAMGGVDEQLINEIQEYHKKRKRRQKRILFEISVAACIALCVSVFAIVTHMRNLTQNSGAGNGYSTFSQTEKIFVNKGSSYFHSKYGGTLRQVKKEIWSEKYDNAIFKCDSRTKYYLSYSKENEVLYGVLEMITKSNQSITVLVGKNSMIDSGYDKLNKTYINEVGIAICSIDDTEGKNTQYGAIYKDSHNAYTIEWGKGDLSGFIITLKEVVEPKEREH